MSNNPQTAIPKWLLYKIVGTVVVMLLVTGGALLYAGILG